MRIRVAIIEQDTGYLEKITNVFNTRYTEQVVQKFLNKWTIFLFCSILFSSNQKEH